MKICIGMPVYNNLVHVQVMQDILDVVLEAQKRNDQLTINTPSSPFLSLNRNVIMQKGLDFDWILMWDSDIQVANGQFIYKMIETAYKHDAAMVGLLVKIKSFDKNQEYACGMKAKDGTGYVRLKEAPVKVQKVDVMGAGITLIRSAWIKNHLQQPYYEFVDIKGDNGPAILPEDWRFCEKIKEKGGKIVVDPTIETIHYGQMGWHHEIK